MSSFTLLCSSFLVAAISAQTSQYFRTNQNFYEYRDTSGSSALSTIKVAYPIKVCTKVGSNQEYSGSVFSLFMCENGGIWGPCNFGGDISGSTCSNPSFYCGQFSSPIPAAIATPSADGEVCIDNTAVTTSTTYMQIDYHCGFTDEQSPAQCPNNNVSFISYGFSRLATGICVDQGNGNYFMATCNNETGEIGTYSDASCSSYTAPHRSYTRSCEKYAFPDSGNGASCRYFQRISACVVNGVDILAATAEPTAVPTKAPTKEPTKIPSVSPSYDPTEEPTADTLDPTTSPTDEPSTEPTEFPTAFPSDLPSEAPSNGPTTSDPTQAPTQNLKPDVTVPDAGGLVTTLDNVTTIYVVFGVLFMFYLFICLYIWCNERRKRKILTTNFQKGNDKEQRIAYLREKNRKRREELMGVGAVGHGDVAAAPPSPEHNIYGYNANHVNDRQYNDYQQMQMQQQHHNARFLGEGEGR